MIRRRLLREQAHPEVRVRKLGHLFGQRRIFDLTKGRISRKRIERQFEPDQNADGTRRHLSPHFKATLICTLDFSQQPLPGIGSQIRLRH